MKLHSLLVLLALALSQVLTAQVNYQEVKSAAENGDIESMNTLGVIYFSGELVSQDYAKAKYWFEKAADNGSMWYHMGELHLRKFTWWLEWWNFCRWRYPNVLFLFSWLTYFSFWLDH